MARPDKAAAVEELKDAFSNSAAAVLTEYRGLTVKDLKGNPQIEAVAAGPYFYFNPPSGRWIMDADYRGETISRTVDLIGRRCMLLEFKFKGD